MSGRHVLIVGASGVIGAAAVDLFGRSVDWNVTTLSRRRPYVASGVRHHHVAADLTDALACAAAIAGLPPVTHLIYAAVKEAPGLVTGWRDADLIAQNGQMFENICDPVAANEDLRHVIVLQGTKAYGGHHHPVQIPAKEDRPRDDHPNFYWLHEDHARQLAAEKGFAVTIFRPQVLLGDAPGVAMNPVLAIGVYGALCHALDLPFAYPGANVALWEMTDAPLLARAMDWAFANPQAADGIFNITNGDVLVPAHAWAEIAAALGHSVAGPAQISLAEFFARPECQAAWTRIAQDHRLAIHNLAELLGQSHHYADLLMSQRLAGKSVPMLVSTIKLRKAGFGDCCDSVVSLLSALERMTELGLLPPAPGSVLHDPA